MSFWEWLLAWVVTSYVVTWAMAVFYVWLDRIAKTRDNLATENRLAARWCVALAPTAVTPLMLGSAIVGEHCDTIFPWLGRRLDWCWRQIGL